MTFLSGRIESFICKQIGAYGPFSCDVCDSWKDIFEREQPKNLDFK